MKIQKVLVTGGAGFIGSAVCRHLIIDHGFDVVNVDKLTYCANLKSLSVIKNTTNYSFELADICDRAAMEEILVHHQPDAIIHLAAESHVDRSIDGPEEFIQTNFVGTYRLLEAARLYWSTQMVEEKKSIFRFLHVSTDEVFGSLGEEGLFTEDMAYAPNSPYSASKAASDHLLRAWNKTYGLPTLLSNCSNNYGSHQFPEKLIPLMIINALQRKDLPVYGKGLNKRDWLHVDDHARALSTILLQGIIGEKYNVGGFNEITNIDVVRIICDLVDELSIDPTIKDSQKLISYVQDRPGHDFRYAIDSSKISTELGWQPQFTFESGIRNTVQWYLENEDWWGSILSDKYDGNRLGLHIK